VTTKISKTPDEAIRGQAFTLLQAGLLSALEPLPLLTPPLRTLTDQLPLKPPAAPPQQPFLTQCIDLPAYAGGGGSVQPPPPPASTDQVNYVINPGCEVWTEATTFTNPPSGTPLTKGWIARDLAAPGYTVSRETNPPDVVSGLYSMKVDVTVPATGVVQIDQDVIPNCAEFAGRNLTFSCKVKTARPGAVTLVVAANGVPVFVSSPHTGSGNFETLSVSGIIPPPITSLTWRIEVDASILVTCWWDEALVYLEQTLNDYQVPSPLALDFNRLQLIETKRIVAPIILVTFFGLNGDADEQYVLTGRVKNLDPIAPAVITLQPNGLPPLGIHSTQKIVATGVVLAGAVFGDLRVAEPQVNLLESWFVAHMVAKTGLLRFVFSNEVQDLGGVVAQLSSYAGLWNNAGANITQIDVLTNSPLGFTGELSLYRMARV